MTRTAPAALILAAGRSLRMNSDRPKVLHKADGLPLIGHVLEIVQGAGLRRIVVVIGTRAKQVRSFLGSLETVTQAQPLGTGHAVLQAEKRFQNWQGDLLILPADAPCLRVSTLREFIRSHQESRAAASILTADGTNPRGYGRILRRGDRVKGIREDLDATDSEKGISEMNSGIYLFKVPLLFQQLRHVRKNTRKKEYYLTDTIEALVRSGKEVRAHKIKDESEILGVNTRLELARAHQVLNQRELERHSKNGVTILDPSQTFVAKKVQIGRDTVVHPFTWIGPDVTIGKRCEIGPFAKICSGSRIGDDAVVGSFVEVVRTTIGAHTSVKHLSYLGDAKVGKRVNIGAGTITANFDGCRKHKTVIEDRALIGCDTILISPVRVGRGAKTGAGAVLTAHRGVPSGKTAVGMPAKILLRKRKGRKK